MASGMLIPYAGSFGGFMPYRMGGGSLSFTAPGTAAIGVARTSFRLSPIAGGMTSMSSGIGQTFRARSGTVTSFGAQPSTRLGGGMGAQMTGPGNRSVVPPSFGYPFYQPPSLLAPAASGAGISM
jgi:hypothetical protein